MVILANSFSLYGRVTPQQARDMNTMLVQCRAVVCDAGPTLNQHRIHGARLLGLIGAQGSDPVASDF